MVQKRCLQLSSVAGRKLSDCTRQGVFKMEKCIENEDELKKFIEENISQSNFSTRLSDAHRNVNASYKIVDANEDLLKNRYLKGSSPNKLLDKKGNRQGKMSYNEGQLPVQQFPENKGSLMFSQKNIKVDEEEKGNYDSYGYNENEYNNMNNYANEENDENYGMRENTDY